MQFPVVDFKQERLTPFLTVQFCTRDVRVDKNVACLSSLLTLTVVLQPLPLLVHKSSFLIAELLSKPNELKKWQKVVRSRNFWPSLLETAWLNEDYIANLRVDKITVSWLVET